MSAEEKLVAMMKKQKETEIEKVSGMKKLLIWMSTKQYSAWHVIIYVFIASISASACEQYHFWNHIFGG